MTSARAKFAHYLADFQSLTQGVGAGAPLWLQRLRDRGWSHFNETGFPTARRGNERWKYTNVGPIAKIEYGIAEKPVTHSNQFFPVYRADGPQVYDLVFLDGRYSAELSSPAVADSTEITVVSLASVALDTNCGLESEIGQYARPEDDAFAALNTAFLYDGAYVRISDGFSGPVAVRISYITLDGTAPKVSYPRTLIVAGKNSDVTVVESYSGPKESVYFTNSVTEISVGNGAQVDHYRLLLEGDQSFHVGTSRIKQAKDSSFSSASFALGTALARNDMEVLFGGPGGFCSLNGLYLTTDRQHIDNLVSINHAEPNCTSRLNYKGILDGRSKAVFGGTVIVDKDAQKSDAEQTDKNLILSRQAEVDSKPSLLIFADDVKCSHGATAGHIDADTLFYLRSRGLDLDTASKMLIQAFAREIIDNIKPDNLREHVESVFVSSIPNKILPIAEIR